MDLKNLLSFVQALDTTYFEWCPDGEHILTSTTAPRLREGNGSVDRENQTNYFKKLA